VPKKVKQINECLFIDTYKSNKIKIVMNEMRVNDSEISIDDDVSGHRPAAQSHQCN